jgi:hypothetical protein
LAHDHADEVVDEGAHRQCFQYAWHGLAMQHSHLHRRLQMRQCGFDVRVATHKTIDLVVQTPGYKLKREMQPPSRA